MEMWAWIGAYLVGFAILQLYLYRYFFNGRSTGGDSAHENATPQPTDGARSAVDASESSEVAVLTCGDCGTPNEFDPAYTFCKSCGSRL